MMLSKIYKPVVPQKPQNFGSKMNDDTDFTDEVTDAAKAAQEIGKIGFLNLLLSPSAKLIGEHWALRIKERLNETEKARLKGMIESSEVKNMEVESAKLSPTTAGALLEWTQGARSVDQSVAPDLARAWQLALRDIFEDSLELLKSLPEMDQNLIELFQAGGEAKKREVDRLEELGLVRCSFSPPWSLEFVYGVIGLGAVLLALNVLLEIFWGREEGASGIQFWGALFFLGIPAWIVPDLLWNARGRVGIFLRKHVGFKIKAHLSPRGLLLREKLGIEGNSQHFTLVEK